MLFYFTGYALALVLPDIDVVLDIMGATAGVAVIFILPGALLHRLAAVTAATAATKAAPLDTRPAAPLSSSSDASLRTPLTAADGGSGARDYVR